MLCVCVCVSASFGSVCTSFSIIRIQIWFVHSLLIPISFIIIFLILSLKLFCMSYPQPFDSNVWWEWKKKLFAFFSHLQCTHKHLHTHRIYRWTNTHTKPLLELTRTFDIDYGTNKFLTETTDPSGLVVLEMPCSASPFTQRKMVRLRMNFIETC